MNIDFSIAKDSATVKLVGDVDEYTSRTLREDIDKLIDDLNGIRVMVFDMKGVSFIDSTGLGFVLGRYKKLKAKRAELLLANVPPQVDKVFRTSGVYTFVPKVD